MRISEHLDHSEPAGLERMSTAGLEELLLLDFQDAESGEAHMDELYHAARVLAERGTDLSAAAERAWERFQEEHLPFAEDRSVFYEDGVAPSSSAVPERRRVSLRRWGVWGTLATAALSILLLSTSVAAANHYDLWKLLARWSAPSVGASS